MSEQPTPRINTLTKRGIFGPMIEAIAEEGRKLERELSAMTADRDTIVIEHTRLRKAYDSLTAERDALLKENEWHPWDEYPDNHRNVLVRTDEDTVTSGYWLADLQQWRSGNHGAVTHWRELPKFKEGK